MKGAAMKVTLERLGIMASYSRPRVSNDNPFSEALFRTCKYRPDWPTKGFATIAEAQAWVKFFANWYNGEHLHSAIRFVTPSMRHAGLDHDALAAGPCSMQMPAHKSRNGGQEKPATGSRLDPSG
jgi:putative transposase